MNKRHVLVTLLLVPLAAGAHAEPRITLDEALGLADTASPVGRIVQLSIERERRGVKASGLWPNPDFSIAREESAGVEEDFLELEFPLPLWGRLGLEREAARHALEAAEAGGRQERTALRARVKLAFIGLLQAQERIVTLEAARGQFAKLDEALRVREEYGESSGFDRLRARAEHTEVELEFLEHRGGREEAREALAVLLALPADGLEASGSLETPVPLPSVAEVLALGRSRGDLLALDAEERRLDFLARSIRRRRIPEPSLTAGTRTTHIGSFEDTGPVIGLGFNLPIFDRGQEANVISAEEEIVRVRREALSRGIDAEVAAAYAVAAARREAESIIGGLGSSDGLRRMALAAYEAGEMSILELLDAYRVDLDVALRAIDVRAEARRADAALELAVGAEVLR